jgi:hypothetical protein
MFLTYLAKEAIRPVLEGCGAMGILIWLITYFIPWPLVLAGELAKNGHMAWAWFVGITAFILWIGIPLGFYVFGKYDEYKRYERG